MASVAEINAGFDALHKKIAEIIQTMLPEAPWMFRSQIATVADKYLNGPDGRRLQLEGVEDVLGAAEKVRAKEAAK